VHCNKGVSRSPSVVIGYLIKTKDMSFKQALRFLVDKRPMVRTAGCCVGCLKV
jgi:protein-tyrosine phosphatase